MKTYNGVFIKQNSIWYVQYDSELGNGIELTNTVLLHPNFSNYAEIHKECEFRIQQCPNLNNGGEWEEMAIIDSGEAKRIGEIIERYRGKEMFPKLTAHAREVLSTITKLPDPNDPPKTYNEDELFQILLDFMVFPHPHEEPRGSIIKRFLEVLKKKKKK